MESFIWYKTVDELQIQQGDFIDNFPIITPVTPQDVKKIELTYYNIVILSHSCDLYQEKLESVIACPFYTLEELGKENSYYNGKNGKESLRKGFAVGYHLLNKCILENFEKDFLIVDFRNTLNIPYGFLKKFVKKQPERLRLMPPYREHLSQAFARFFMRVGLPIDIPPFT